MTIPIFFKVEQINSREQIILKHGTYQYLGGIAHTVKIHHILHKCEKSALKSQGSRFAHL